MISAEILRAIVESPKDDFRELAAIAGGDPATFYRGANFNDADLRGQDLRGFSLHAATFERARVDRRTRVDGRYRKQVGLARVKLRLLTGNAILEAARGKIGRRAFSAPLLGDMIEEAVFERLQSPRKTRRALEVKLIPVSDSAGRPSDSIRPSTTKPLYGVMGLAEAFKRFFRTTSAREDQTQRNRIAHQAFLPMESSGLPIGLDHIMIASVTSQTFKSLVDLKPRDNPVELFANTLLLEHLGLTQVTIPMADLKKFGYPSGPDIGVDLEAEVGGKRVLIQTKTFRTPS